MEKFNKQLQRKSIIVVEMLSSAKCVVGHLKSQRYGIMIYIFNNDL